MHKHSVVSQQKAEGGIVTPVGDGPFPQSVDVVHQSVRVLKVCIPICSIASARSTLRHVFLLFRRQEFVCFEPSVKLVHVQRGFVRCNFIYFLFDRLFIRSIGGQKAFPAPASKEPIVTGVR